MVKTIEGILIGAKIVNSRTVRIPECRGKEAYRGNLALEIRQDDGNVVSREMPLFYFKTPFEMMGIQSLVGARVEYSSKVIPSTDDFTPSCDETVLKVKTGNSSGIEYKTNDYV